MTTNGRRKVSLGRANTAILDGTEDLSQWSDEELLRGQRKNKRGTWTGTKPTVVPMAVHNELVRRKMSEAFDLLRDNIVAATRVLVEVATDEKVDPAVRLKAAGMILDRTLGKAAERIDVRTDLTAEQEPWQAAIVAAVVPESSAGDVILEVVEVDDDEPDQPRRRGAPRR